MAWRGPALHEQERDKQAPDAAVAVKERVDRLELGVSERCLDKGGKVRRVVQEAFKVIQRRVHVYRGRRHERSVLNPGTFASDPGLGGPKLAGLHTGMTATPPARRRSRF